MSNPELDQEYKDSPVTFNEYLVLLNYLMLLDKKIEQLLTNSEKTLKELEEIKTLTRSTK